MEFSDSKVIMSFSLGFVDIVQVFIRSLHVFIGFCIGFVRFSMGFYGCFLGFHKVIIGCCRSSLKDCAIILCFFCTPAMFFSAGFPYGFCKLSLALSISLSLPL